jgi:hypothetical protein
MQLHKLIATSVATLVGFLAVPAQATFVEDSDPGGEKFFIDKPDNGSTSFCGVVGTNQGCEAGTNDFEVNVEADVGVQTGNGYANIRPDDNQDLLTTLTFTPENPSIFGDFSFRGQPEADVTEENPIVVTVTDNQGNPAQIFNFFGFTSNADFARIGIVSLDGQTIREVTIFLASGFREVKQIDFSFSSSLPVPEPASLALLGLGLIGLGLARRRKVN